ncbi:MAG: T9SS type A sorting domain-containing protein [Chitinophagaceae bacterium]|nr:T9SS type A sorting domain-containing protein [Chitinophagaceae bacterium]
MKRIALPVFYFCSLLFFVISCFSAKGQPTYTSQADGDWNASSTWGGPVPGSGDNVVINHAVFFNSAITRNSGTTTTINANHSLTAQATITNNGTTNVYGTFQLDNGGYADGNNFFHYFTGSYLVFNNGSNYDINSGQRFWPSTSNAPDNVQINTGSSATLNDASKTVNNLILWGGFTNNQTLTINGTLTINTNGFIGGNSPTYGTGSTLIYATGTTFGLGQEWRASSSPYNVEITNNTTLSYSTIPEERSINGNLTIDGGSKLDYGTASQMTGALIVKENATVSGTLTLGAFYGDDLKIGGNLIFNSGYSFNPNKRAVFFIKESGTQTITTPSNGDLTIPYIRIGATTGSGTILQLEQNLNISADGASAGDALIFYNNNDVLDMNGHNLSIGNSGLANTITGPGAFKGSTTSDLTLINQGSIGTIQFATGSQTLRNLILNCTSGQTAAVLGSNLTLTGSGTTFNGGLLNIGNYNLTFGPSAAYTISGTGNYILTASGNTGTVTKNFSSAGSFTYPIGDASNYTPATVNLTSVTGTPSVSMNVVNAQHPQNNVSTNYLNRYWRVTSTGTFTGDATFTYVPGDVFGTESSLITAGWNGTNWNLYGNVNTGAHSLEISGESNLNKEFTAGDNFSPVATLPDNYFRSKQTGDWDVASNWESSPNGTSNWTTATLAPTSEAKQIDILSGHTINVASNISLNNSRVYGKLSLLTGGKISIPNSDPDGILVKEGGIFEVATTGSYSTSITLPTGTSLISSPLHVETNGTVIVNEPISGTAGAGYDNLAISTYNRWENRAKFIWNNNLNFAFGTSTNSITYFPTAGANTIPYFIISTPVNSGSGGTTTFNGLTIVNAASTFSGGGNKVFRNGISGNASLTQDGGINNPGNFQITGNNAILGGANLTLNLTRILNLNANLEVPSDSVVTINKQTGVGSSGSISKGSGIVFTINGTADMTTINMNNGSGNVTINGHLLTAASDGLTGSSNSTISSGTVNVNTGSTVEYNAAGSQDVTNPGTGGTAANYYNLILSNSGTKTPAFTFSPTGTITIKDDAIFDCTERNIGGANTNLTMTDNSRLIVGTTGTQPSIDGTYDLEDGTIEFANNSGTAQTIKHQNIANNKIKYHNIEVSGTNVRNSSGNIQIGENGTFTVLSGGIYTSSSGNASIVGVGGVGQTVKVKSGGIFRTAVVEGFYGPPNGTNPSASVQTSIPNIDLEEGSTIEYSREASGTDLGNQSISIMSSVDYQNLVLSGDGEKTVPASSILNINGNFTVKDGANFKHNGGTVTFVNTNNEQDISTESATYPPVFYNLKNQNTQNLNINNFISVKNELILDDNSKINLKDIVRLVSDEDGTASVPPIPEGANAATIAYDVNGAFRVERFIPGHTKAWQTLSVPTKGSTIFNSWQNSRVYEQYKGTTITAPFNDWAARGFDIKSSSPSMKVYDPATDTYVGVPNTSMLIDKPNGYMFFVRGDRSVTETWEPATEVTLQTTGKLYAPTPPGEGPVTVSVSPNSFAMVGNPYASSIKYDQITLSSNLQWDYYIWDPQLTSKPDSKYGLGGFRAILKDDSKATPESGNYMNGSIPPIQSGQAFFVFNPSAKPGTVSFTESAKVSGSNLILRPGKETIKNPEVAINLFTGPAGEETLMDGAKLIFNDEYSPEVNQQDTKKIGSSNDAIYIVASPYPLSIERRPLPAEKDTIFFGLSSMKARGYSLEINTNVMSEAGYEIYFHDKLLKTVKQLDDGDNKIAFEVTKDPASKATGRFFLTLKPALPPFAFADERAKLSGDEVAVSWRGLQQTQVDRFIVEHSTDGAAFNNKGNVAVTKGESGDYIFTASEPQSGINYYRIKAVMKDGSLVYSKIVSVMVQFRASAISISPNPAKEVIRIQFYRMSKGDYSVRIYSADGKLVMNRKLSHPGGTADYRISPQAMAKGIYHVDIIKPDGSKTGEQLLLDK